MRFPRAVRTSFALVLASATSLVLTLDAAADHHTGSIGVQETTLTVPIPAIGVNDAELCLDVGGGPIPDGVDDPVNTVTCENDITVPTGSTLTLTVAAQRTSPPILALGDPGEEGFCPDSAGVRLVHYKDADDFEGDGLTITYKAAVTYENDTIEEITGVEQIGEDEAGQQGTEGYERNAWLCLKNVPADPPITTLHESPASSTRDTTARFRFSTPKLGSTFECSLDDARFSACSSPVEYSGLAEGDHEFAVRAVDVNARRGPEVPLEWTIDRTAPAVAIDTAPASTVTTGDASFAFTTEPGAATSCSLDGAPFADCSSPATYRGLSDGDHTFAVVARDAAGNQSDAATWEWTVDLPQPPTNPTSGGQSSGSGAAAAGATAPAGTATGAVPIPLRTPVQAQARLRALDATITLRRQSLRRVLARGLRFSLDCSLPCRSTAELRSRSTGRLLGRLSAAGAEGPRAMVLRLTRSGRAALAKRRRATVVLLVRVSDSAGSQRTISRAVTLRR